MIVLCENNSLFLDVLILIDTFQVVILGKGSRYPMEQPYVTSITAYSYGVAAIAFFMLTLLLLTSWRVRISGQC